jgi:hypothetical protein
VTYTAEERAEDLEIRRKSLEDTSRIMLGRWHWLRAGRYGEGEQVRAADVRMQDVIDKAEPTATRYHPCRALDTFRGRVLVGLAGGSRTEWVEAWRVTRQLSGYEHSVQLRREPVDRAYDPPEMVPRGLAENRAEGLDTR